MSRVVAGCLCCSLLSLVVVIWVVAFVEGGVSVLVYAVGLMLGGCGFSPTCAGFCWPRAGLLVVLSGFSMCNGFKNFLVVSWNVRGLDDPDKCAIVKNALVAAAPSVI